MQETTLSTHPIAAPVADAEIDAMFKAGVHLGHVKSKNHPSMQTYIFGVHNTISVIDLLKTKEKLALALTYIKGIAARSGTILLVGTRPGVRKALIELAEKTKMPYFAERWIGGTLSNFKVIAKRVEYMEQLEKERATGEFEKYTKKERLRKGEEIERLKKNFDGLRALKRLPDAVFIVDTTYDDTAVHESRVIGANIIALVDTNANANVIAYPIPANDDALPAVTYMTQRIADAILEGQHEAATAASAQAQVKKEE